MMDRAIDRELKNNYPVETLPEDQGHPYLDAASIEYVGIKSEHFRVYGNWEPAVLIEAARNAERCLAFCEEVFEGHKGFTGKRMVWILVFFRERTQWQDVLRANAKQFPQGQLKFILENTGACAMGRGKNRMHLSGAEDPQTVQDLAMRWVAQNRSGFKSDALVEGIGHAVVGRFFGRNLVSLVGQERERARTVVGREEKKKLLLPDLASWETQPSSTHGSARERP